MGLISLSDSVVRLGSDVLLGRLLCSRNNLKLGRVKVMLSQLLLERCRWRSMASAAMDPATCGCFFFFSDGRGSGSGLLTVYSTYIFYLI